MKAARRCVGIVIAVGLGGLYSIGFHVVVEGLIAASEKSGTTSPLVTLLLVQAVLFGASFFVAKLTRRIEECVPVMVIFFAAVAFSVIYYSVVGDIVNGVFAGLGATVFTAPAVGAFLLVGWSD